MLTDIFAHRYEDQLLWPTVDSKISRMLVQGYRLLEGRIRPYWVDGKESEIGKRFWKELHDGLSMELGLISLSPLAYSYQVTYNGKLTTRSNLWTMNKVCENWFMAPLQNSSDANRYVQERISLIEIGFRMRETELRLSNADLERNIEFAHLKPRTGIRLPGDIGEGMRASSARLNAEFLAAVEELNTRFRHANAGLSYHNGFVQISADALIGQRLETPFWSIVAAPELTNVDADMKEAVDRLDNNGRDPAFYAARALESAIKIISSAKGWSTGKERGAHNYIDTLAAKRGGFLLAWEVDMLKNYFSHIRNPLGHGPGAEPMAELSSEQTSFAIETAMVWIKNLTRRASL